MTLLRATLVGAVAALVADALLSDPRLCPPLVAPLSWRWSSTLSNGGRRARRTGTASPLGARFDGEVDAFLILVLSVYVARSIGPWVFAIGAARYVFLVRLAAAVDARGAACALLAENRGGDPRHHAHGRGGGCLTAARH